MNSDTYAELDGCEPKDFNFAFVIVAINKFAFACESISREKLLRMLSKSTLDMT